MQRVNSIFAKFKGEEDKACKLNRDESKKPKLTSNSLAILMSGKSVSGWLEDTDGRELKGSDGCDDISLCGELKVLINIYF